MMAKGSDYYKCGLLKWSAAPLFSRIKLIISVIALVVALVALYK
jgi:hypothetical protein